MAMIILKLLAADLSGADFRQASSYTENCLSWRGRSKTFRGSVCWVSWHVCLPDSGHQQKILSTVFFNVDNSNDGTVKAPSGYPDWVPGLSGQTWLQEWLQLLSPKPFLDFKPRRLKIGVLQVELRAELENDRTWNCRIIRMDLDLAR